MITSHFSCVFSANVPNYPTLLVEHATLCNTHWGPSSSKPLSNHIKFLTLIVVFPCLPSRLGCNIPVTGLLTPSAIGYHRMSVFSGKSRTKRLLPSCRDGFQSRFVKRGVIHQAIHLPGHTSSGLFSHGTKWASESSSDRVGSARDRDMVVDN